MTDFITRSEATESEKHAARLALEALGETAPSMRESEWIEMAADYLPLAPAEPEPDELSVNTDDLDRRAHFDLDTSGWSEPDTARALPEVPPMPLFYPASVCRAEDQVTLASSVRALHAFATEMAQEVGRLRAVNGGLTESFYKACAETEGAESERDEARAEIAALKAELDAAGGQEAVCHVVPDPEDKDCPWSTAYPYEAGAFPVYRAPVPAREPDAVWTLTSGDNDDGSSFVRINHGGGAELLRLLNGDESCTLEVRRVRDGEEV